MKSKLQSDLHELIAAGILTEATADQIQSFYAAKEKDAPNRFFNGFSSLRCHIDWPWCDPHYRT